MERCPNAFARCSERPPVIELSPGHRSMCWLADGVQETSAVAGVEGSGSVE
ncbi:hypothetical protein D3C79_1115020 [compost metagenome]